METIFEPAEAAIDTGTVDTAPDPAPARGRPARAGIELAPEPARTAVEVVLITRNSRTELARSLSRIREATAVAGGELLIVDLGSTDGTLEFVAKQAPGARGVWLEAEDGLVEAIDAATACSDADVLVVLRPTLEPCSPDAIAQLVEHLEEHPTAAIAAPVLRSHAGGILLSARAVPTAAMLLATRTRFGARWARRRLERASHPREGRDGFARVEWVLGDAFAVRRADLEPVEDLDLCIRLRRRGREIHYLPAVELLDASGRAAARASRVLPSSGQSQLRFLLRHPRYAVRPGLVRGMRARALVSRVLHRTFDIVVASVLLVVLAPVLLAITLGIRLDSRGPALFRQRRLGGDAQPFDMYKFRTMLAGADSTPHEQYVQEMIVNGWRTASNGSRAAHPQIFKLHPDPRVTRVGRLLRRLSLDELPQLYNVLRGHMTLIGFRPPIPYEVDLYPSWYYRRFDAKPGLTGLWQVSGRNEHSYEEMVALDIEYLNRRTWLLDLQLLIRTVGAVLSGRGAY